MCDPTGWVVAETAAALLSQQQNASAQKKFNKEQFESTKAAADANAVRNYFAIQARQKQEHEKINQSIESAHKEALAARGIARTSAGESGVAGNSVAALDAEFKRTEAEYQSRLIRSQAYMDDQFGRDYEGVRAGQEAQIRSGVGPAVAGPDFVNLLVRAGSKIARIKYDEKVQALEDE